MKRVFLRGSKTEQGLRKKVMNTKMGLLGHVCRKTKGRMMGKFLLGMNAGMRARGRSKRYWLDDIEG